MIKMTEDDEPCELRVHHSYGQISECPECGYFPTKEEIAYHEERNRRWDDREDKRTT
jgi:hypothetical protein